MERRAKELLGEASAVSERAAAEAFERNNQGTVLSMPPIDLHDLAGGARGRGRAAGAWAGGPLLVTNHRFDNICMPACCLLPSRRLLAPPARLCSSLPLLGRWVRVSHLTSPPSHDPAAAAHTLPAVSAALDKVTVNVALARNFVHAGTYSSVCLSSSVGGPIRTMAWPEFVPQSRTG